MSSRILVRVICQVLVIVLGLGVQFYNVPFTYGSDENLNHLYQIVDGEGQYNKFINKVHGYSVSVDKDLTVDMNYSKVCAVLENESKRIEIYKQILPSGVSSEAYINYSNKFIQNTVDHVKEYESKASINGRTVHILQWSREKLKRVENDKNYYVSIEIISGKREVYTIFIKSIAPFYQSGGYHYIINDFTTFSPLKAAYMKQAQPIALDDRGWNKETQNVYLQYFSTDSTLEWGIFEPYAPDDFTQLKYIEEEMNYEFPFLLNYSSFENHYKHPNLTYRLKNAHKQNKILELTLQTSWTETGQSNMVYDVLNGKYDVYLKDYAKTISDFNHPVLFRLGNEMNGDWCPYSSYHTSKDTEIFKEFYKYIYKIFEEAKADNVIWIWNPNGKSFPDFEWNQAVMYYPGDEYVDIVGLTAYNTGTYYPDEKWTEFADMYDSLYDEYVNLYNKPMMITEFASSSVGGDKNQWIKDMFSHIYKYENIKVAIWWDGCDWDANGNVARPYFIDETPEIIKTFRKYLNKSSLFWDAYG